MVYVHNYFPALLRCKLRSIRTHCVNTIGYSMVYFTISQVFHITAA